MQKMTNITQKKALDALDKASRFLKWLKDDLEQKDSISARIHLNLLIISLYDARRALNFKKRKDS